MRRAYDPGTELMFHLAAAPIASMGPSDLARAAMALLDQAMLPARDQCWLANALELWLGLPADSLTNPAMVDEVLREVALGDLPGPAARPTASARPTPAARPTRNLRAITEDNAETAKRMPAMTDKAAAEILSAPPSKHGVRDLSRIARKR